jgi:hypothetical protein
MEFRGDDMIDINYYRKIQNAYGANSLRDVQINQIKMDLNRDFDKSLDCERVLIDGVEHDLTIIETNNLDEKKIKARPNDSFHSGQVVYWADWYWIITKVNRRDEIVSNGEMKECTYHLYWQNANGDIIDKWAFITNASSYSNGVTGNATITLSANQFMVVMPKDSDTVNLRDTRMFIDNCTNDKPTPYKLTRPDNVSNDYGSGCTYYIFTLDQRNDDKDKKVILEDGTTVWIADYIAPTTPSQPENPDETVVLSSTISGSQTLKVGYPKTYSVIFMDKSGVAKTDVVFTWNIVSEFTDKIVSTVNGQSITLKISNEDYVDENLKLQVVVDGVVNSELIITVAGLF